MMRLIKLLVVILVVTMIGVFTITSLSAAFSRQQLEKRLNQLKAEYNIGQKKLNDLEAQEAALRDSLTRINGAIQTIEDELAQSGKE